ncbi:SpoVR family protein [Heliorestis acidaminivorans]|uniref:SpoVR family protein n=1 Tax=Heliorestis acidaminivorans TaxID=553427 RepID=A0A6I0EPJ5_9FIRM|nr:SpoVR family protein [Heliorestis acidaminivorans]KAB2951165.1 SpoVR family protein [Heliorestis acidaminivorans]
MNSHKSPIDRDIDRLTQSIPKIMKIAGDFDLDFYEMRFEIVPADVLYTFGAYGMPTRFAHWSFGKTFQKMKMSYDYNLSRIYELVINSDPCYAFLLEGNQPIQNEMVSAHVLAHCDFFKNNAAFAGTSRFMVESMASSAERIRRYEIEQGREKVEKYLDSALALQEHIDPFYRTIQEKKDKKDYHKSEGIYDDLFQLDKLLAQDKENHALVADKESEKEELTNDSDKNLVKAKKDLLLFLMVKSPFLDDWQRDILSIVRDEMFYFWPQIRTKIMNEGWGYVSEGA